MAETPKEIKVNVTTDKPKGLVMKLAEVMAEVNKVEKAGFNKAQSYAYARESDVANAVRGLLAERHVWLWSSTANSSTEPLYETASHLTMWLTKVTMEYQFIDGETGEVSPVQIYEGQGADTGDKALPKAQSMALKYFLLKSFIMSTGVDDAEADEKVDKAAAAAGAAEGAKVAKGGTAVQRGGHQDNASTAQVNEIIREIKRLKLDRDAFIAFSTAAIGRTVAEEEKVDVFLRSLSNEDAAKLVRSLADFATPETPPTVSSEDVHTESTDVDEKAQPAAFTVV